MALLVCQLHVGGHNVVIMLSIARSLHLCRVSQPRLDIIYVTLLVRSFDTNHAALRWTFSILWVSVSVNSAQVVEAYSTIGRTKVL